MNLIAAVLGIALLGAAAAAAAWQLHPGTHGETCQQTQR